MSAWRQAAIDRLRAWAARRHGADALPLIIERRRIYILPTRFGLLFAALIVAMLVAGLNYNSNLGLAMAFLMAGLALVAMHHCHRNLQGLSVDVNLEADTFVGQDAVFGFTLRNQSALDRRDIEIRLAPDAEAVQSVGARSDARAMVGAAVSRRGARRFGQFELRTRYPLGWFRAWTYVQGSLAAYAAPQPRGERRPRAGATEGSVPRSEAHGDEDFAGLRPYVPGVPLKHMAWKVLARGGDAAVRGYTGMAAQPEWLEWSALEGLDDEARLSQLCRWVLASEGGFPRPYGLRMPGVEISPGRGPAHRARCLRALAMYPGDSAPTAGPPP